MFHKLGIRTYSLHVDISWWVCVSDIASSKNTNRAHGDVDGWHTGGDKEGVLPQHIAPDRKAICRRGRLAMYRKGKVIPIIILGAFEVGTARALWVVGPNRIVADIDLPRMGIVFS